MCDSLLVYLLLDICDACSKNIITHSDINDKLIIPYLVIQSYLSFWSNEVTMIKRCPLHTLYENGSSLVHTVCKFI